MTHHKTLLYRCVNHGRYSFQSENYGNNAILQVLQAGQMEEDRKNVLDLDYKSTVNSDFYDKVPNYIFIFIMLYSDSFNYVIEIADVLKLSINRHDVHLIERIILLSQNFQNDPA